MTDQQTTPTTQLQVLCPHCRRTCALDAQGSQQLLDGAAIPCPACRKQVQAAENPDISTLALRAQITTALICCLFVGGLAAVICKWLGMISGVTCGLLQLVMFASVWLVFWVSNQLPAPVVRCRIAPATTD